MDGRTDLYDDAFLRDYLSIVFCQENWQDKLEQYGVRLVLIESESTLAQLLSETPNWELAYQDEMASVYVRE